MLELLLVVLILFAVAYFAYNFLPHPIGLIAAFVIVVIALFWLIDSMPHHHCC